MKLDRIELQGFGKFHNTTLDFFPGLNLIYGENESGKSTLQNFLRGMLFGFKKPGTRRSYEEALERYRPWQGQDYYGTLQYTLDGKSYRIERNFDPAEEKVRVLDAENWTDVTAQFPMDKRREVLFAQEHLGMTRIVFDNTVCIRQMQSKSSKELVGEIQTKLVNLASAGEEEISVQRALQGLDDKLRELGLSERSSRTVLGRLAAQVERLEQERLQTLQAYEDVRQAEASLRRLEQELLLLEQQRECLTLESTALEAQELSSKIAKITEYDRQIAELAEVMAKTPVMENFPFAAKEKLLVALERQRFIATAEKEVDLKGEELSQRLNTVQKTLAGLKAYAGFSEESFAAVEKSFTKLTEIDRQAGVLEHKKLELLRRRRLLEEQRQQLAGCARLGPEGEEQARQLEGEINRLQLQRAAVAREQEGYSEGDLARRSKHYTWLALGSLVSGAGFGLLMLAISPYFGFVPAVGILLALWLWLKARRDRQSLIAVRKKISLYNGQLKFLEQEILRHKEQLSALLDMAETGSTAELAEKMRQLAIIEHERRNLQLALASTEEELLKLHRQIREETRVLESRFLAPAGVIKPGDKISYDQVEEFCRGLKNYLHHKAEEKNFLSRRQQLGEQKAKLASDALAAQREVAKIMQAVGVKDPEEFMALWEIQQGLLEAKKSLAALQKARDEVLGVTDLAGLEEALAQMNQELAAKQWVSQTRLRPKEVVSADLAEVNAKIQANKESIANLAGIIATRLQRVRNLTEIETELMAAWEAKEQVLKRKKSVELAKEVIMELSGAVQREFAPKVNEYLGRTISSLTAGRYSAVKIDQNLNMRVVVPEVGEVKEIISLSLGTIDQFYFAMRLALADLIGTKFPLILDEPFIQYDDRRLEGALKVLLTLAAERQIVLFSCHRRELAILENLAPRGFNLIRL